MRVEDNELSSVLDAALGPFKHSPDSLPRPIHVVKKPSTTNFASWIWGTKKHADSAVSLESIRIPDVPPLPAKTPAATNPSQLSLVRSIPVENASETSHDETVIPSVVISVRDNAPQYYTPLAAQTVSSPPPPPAEPKTGFWGSIWKAVSAPFQSSPPALPPPLAPTPTMPVPQPSSTQVPAPARPSAGLALIIEDSRPSLSSRPSHDGARSFVSNKSQVSSEKVRPPVHPASNAVVKSSKSGNSGTWFNRTFGRLWPFSSSKSTPKAPEPTLLPMSTISSTPAPPTVIHAASLDADRPKQSLEHRLSSFHETGYLDAEECPDCEGTQFLADGRMCMRCDQENSSPTTALLGGRDNGFGDRNDYASSTGFGWAAKDYGERDKDVWTGIVNGNKLRSNVEKAKEKLADLFGFKGGMGMFGNERRALRRGSVEIIDDFAVRGKVVFEEKWKSRGLKAAAPPARPQPKAPKMKVPTPYEPSSVKCKKAVKAVKKKVAKLVTTHKRAEAIKELENFWALGDPRSQSTTSLDTLSYDGEHPYPAYAHQQQYPHHQQQYIYQQQSAYTFPHQASHHLHATHLQIDVQDYDKPLIDFESDMLITSTLQRQQQQQQQPYPAHPAYLRPPAPPSQISSAASAPSVPSTLEVIPDSLQQLYMDLLSSNIGMDELRDRYLWTKDEHNLEKMGLSSANRYPVQGQDEFVARALGGAGRVRVRDEDEESDDGLGYIYGEDVGTSSGSGSSGSEVRVQGSVVEYGDSVIEYGDSVLGFGEAKFGVGYPGGGGTAPRPGVVGGEGGWWGL
ncbi:hypothetical protein HDV00_010296 [Rhizophlyctis rosea]|nr:hypothetical protein HDV00_010296 [Rhizophlyctis rosea]